MPDDLSDLLEIPPARFDQALADPRFRTRTLCNRLLGRLADERFGLTAETDWPAEIAVRLAARISRPLLGLALERWQIVQRQHGQDPAVGESGLFEKIYRDSWMDHGCRLARDAEDLLRRGQTDRASELLRQSLNVYAGLQETHHLGCAHARLAAVHRASRRFDRAITETLDALRLLDRARDAERFDRTVYGLSSSLRRSREVRPRVATELQGIRRRRYLRGMLPWAQHRWLEGVVFSCRHQSDRAIRALSTAWRHLAKLGAGRDLSLLALDFIDLHLADDIRLDAETVARDTVAELRALDAGDELVAPLERCAQILARPDDSTSPTQAARSAILDGP